MLHACTAIAVVMLTPICDANQCIYVDVLGMWNVGIEKRNVKNVRDEHQLHGLNSETFFHHYRLPPKACYNNKFIHMKPTHRCTKRRKNVGHTSFTNANYWLNVRRTIIKLHFSSTNHGRLMATNDYLTLWTVNKNAFGVMTPIQYY